MRQNAEQIRQEALTRAVTGQSMSNYPAIFQGFTAKGIPEDQINPRVNILSFHAWKALGRHVRKGEHGVSICTIRTETKRNKETGKEETISFPWYVRVFHISQTDPDDHKSVAAFEQSEVAA